MEEITTHKAIALKYRPQKFSEIVGQEAVVTTLMHAVKRTAIHPCYIFSGIRGVGKTTAARIFAKSINCRNRENEEPCGKCPSCVEIASSRCMDVLEIDGASNTGIENVKDLQEIARYAPSRDPFKIFIIDEVHMLSEKAFNAFLKTLEEPPPRVAFIMATTEYPKVPETIRSRSQHFHFRKVKGKQIMEHLKYICGKEKIQINEDALMLIAKSAEGSVRDSQTHLDRVSAYCTGLITAEDVADLLGLVRHAFLESMANALFNQDCNAVLQSMNLLSQRGEDIERFLFLLTDFYRGLLILKLAPSLESNLLLTSEELDGMKALAGRYSEGNLLRSLDLMMDGMRKLKGSSDPQIVVESVLVKIALLPRLLPLRHTAQPLPEAKYREQDQIQQENKEPVKIAFTSITPVSPATEEETMDGDSTQKLIEMVIAKAPMYGESLRKCEEISMDGYGVLHILFAKKDDFHKKVWDNKPRFEILFSSAKEIYPDIKEIDITYSGDNEGELKEQNKIITDPLIEKAMGNPAIKLMVSKMGGEIISVDKITNPGAEESGINADEPFEKENI